MLEEMMSELRFARMKIDPRWNEDYKNMMIGIKRFMIEKYAGVCNSLEDEIYDCLTKEEAEQRTKAKEEEYWDLQERWAEEDYDGRMCYELAAAGDC